MDSKTFGSGATYSDINAWVSYVQGALVSGGNLTDDVTAMCVAAGLTTSSQQIVSGWAPGGSGYTTTITTNTGASFSENASVRSNALYYNTSNGAFIVSSYSATAGAINIQVNKSRFTKLQVRTTGGYTLCLSYTTTSMDDLEISGNILLCESGINGAIYFSSVVDGANIVVKNNCVRNDRGAAASKTFYSDGNTTFTNRVKLYNNTFWQAVSANSNVGGGSGTYCEVIGNVFLNNTTCSLAIRDAQCNGSNNASNRAAWDATGYGAGTITGLTASQLSITVANEFVDADGTPTDFRLKAGGTALQDTNIAISGITTDISLFTRTATYEDIGCWQLTSGGGGGTVRRSMAALGVG